MFQSLSFYIGLRYLRAKRRNGFISFISLASMLGIALGVMVLITALSIMNGFNYEIKSRFFALMPEVTVLTGGSLGHSWKTIANGIETLPEVTGIAPFSSGKAIIMKGAQVFGVEAMGILASEQDKVSQLSAALVAGNLHTLLPNHFNVIIGQTLARNLGVTLGDKITLFTPQTSVSLAGMFPRYRRLTVTGIFHGNEAFGFDMAYVFMNMQDAQNLFSDNAMSGLNIKLQNMYQAVGVRGQIQDLLPPGFAVTDWTRDNGAFFQALLMEKTILLVVLLLIIAVAAFNLVATLVMVVQDKRSDIAILRTLGATPAMILKTVLVQGLVVGIIGTLLGLALGLLLADNATGIVNAYQHLFHVQLLQASVFFVDFLPSRIEASDVVMVCSIAIFLSVLAALYPAWLACRTEPAEALRYE